MLSQHLDKNNLHHAYLIEGAGDKIILEVTEFLKSLNIRTVGNPDFVNISTDNLKINEAFDLRLMSTGKSFSSAKKIFVIQINNISLDAQNVLLKMFEEPTEDTHFFLIMPDTNFLLKTFISRFYFISARQDLAEEEIKEAEKFITLPLKNRIDFIKELLLVPEDKGEEVVLLDSSRSKALKFLNELEFVLHDKVLSRGTLGNLSIDFFNHFLKVREFLRMPGSSTKSLMESVALITPNMLQ